MNETRTHTDVVRRARGERGQVMIMVAGAMIVLVAFLGFVVDIGRVLVAKRQLQNSTDLASQAGALDIVTTESLATGNTTAKATARLYGAETGQKNASTLLTNVSLTASVVCTESISQSLLAQACAASSQPNTMVVTQTARVNTIFARVVGFTYFDISATAKAAARAGGLPPLDVQLVVDTTFSMAGTKIDAAKTGLRTLLNQLWPCPAGSPSCTTQPVDKVGLSIFPPILVSSISKELDGTATMTSSDLVNYNATSPQYQIVALTNNYKTSPTSLLVTSSNLYLASQLNPAGLETPNNSTIRTYIAGVITDTATRLINNGRANAKNVIILLSDGDSNAPSAYVPGGNQANQCQAAVTAARNAAAATSPNDAWVYSVAYGATTSTTGSSTNCPYDSPRISPCDTMRQIASSKGVNNDASKFYSDNAAGCVSSAHPSITDLNQIFAAIARDLQNSRLLE